MYDLDSDDRISKDELLAILHMMVGANIRYERNRNVLYKMAVHTQFDIL
jgi:calcineurin B family protein 1